MSDQATSAVGAQLERQVRPHLGPWRAGLKTQKTNNIGIYNRVGELVATIDVHQLASLEGRRRKWADACAMAAAPDLLDALQDVLAYFDAPHDQCFSDAALAKARAAVTRAVGAA